MNSSSPIRTKERKLLLRFWNWRVNESKLIPLIVRWRLFVVNTIIAVNMIIAVKTIIAVNTIIDLVRDTSFDFWGGGIGRLRIKILKLDEREKIVHRTIRRGKSWKKSAERRCFQNWRKISCAALLLKKLSCLLLKATKWTKSFNPSPTPLPTKIKWSAPKQKWSGLS